MSVIGYVNEQTRRDAMFESELGNRKGPPNGSPCHVLMEEWIIVKSPKKK